VSDTIFAVASGPGRAAVAILRISGPGTRELITRLAGRLPSPRRATLRALRDSADEVLDRSLLLWFPEPNSYTGEDCAELHLHGSRAVIGAVSETLATWGARPAEPGEFTRRAFLHGRIDLTEAEAVADLVDAETSAQRHQALRQLSGALGHLYAGWANRLLRLLARQEALIDFPDEDLPAEVEAEALEEIAALQSEIEAHLRDGRRGERLREGLVMAITGPPNAGKSTLVNALADREVAIVSPIPGTTRDVLEARIELGGVPVTLLDTAGLHESSDVIEREGIRRALDRAGKADVVVTVTEAGAAAFPELSFEGETPVLRVASKVDLHKAPADGAIRVSAVTGEGMDALREQLGAIARRLTQAEGPPPLTRARHRAALMEAAARLAAARAALLPELRGEDLRLALRSIGRVTGKVGVEDVLDSVFQQFCIGK
jgi:tRNA modification GTPase